MMVQRNEIAQLSADRKHLEESRVRLEAAKALAQSKHDELSERLVRTRSHNLLFVLRINWRNVILHGSITVNKFIACFR